MHRFEKLIFCLTGLNSRLVLHTFSKDMINGLKDIAKSVFL